MGNVILRVQGAESTVAIAELTIERILAEARAVGLSEFAVLRNGEEITNPNDLSVVDGDIIVILPADYEDVEISVDIANDSDDNDDSANDSANTNDSSRTNGA
ncbi:MAG: hypothetical protein JKY91_00845 [Emcibacter sp.]|nr:hypothetical protein [Emcibacter sp.]MBL4894206.1 hypothetical protein [Emcibacter sp.]